VATFRHHLKNGMTVIVREDRRNPVAAFFMFYRVGARFERPGATGVTHWVEHMMFKGTPRFPRGTLDRLVSTNGGVWNGFTTEDLTAFFETLPADCVELGLEVEADRMVNCLFGPAEVAAERGVILAEREGAENDPIFWLDEAVTAAAFRVHPYRLGVIGAREDLVALTRDELFAYYQRHYVPENAVAVLVGDIDIGWAAALLDKHFEAIPGGPGDRPEPPSEPRQDGERRLTVGRPGPTNYVLFAYHTPPAGHPRTAALLVLDAVMSGGKSPLGWGGRTMGRSSRLYRALIQARLATTVSTRIGLTADPGLLTILATARAGVGAAALERVIAVEVDRLMAEEISAAELDRAKKQVRAQLAYSAEGVEQQAMSLGLTEVLSCPSLADELPELVLGVTAAEVRAAAGEFLGPDNRTVGRFVPDAEGRGEGTLGQAAASRGRAHRVKAGGAFFFRTPGAGGRTLGPRLPGPGTSLPGPETIARRRLANGVTALAVTRPGLELAVTRATLTMAYPDEAEARAGFRALAAEGALHGNTRRSFERQNEETDALGLSLSASSDPDTITLSTASLGEDFSKALSLLTDAVLAPTFPEAEVDKLKGQFLTRLSEGEADSRRLAARLFHETAYPAGHPYRYPALGHPSDVGRAEAVALRRFYRARLVPDRLILAAVGGLDREAMLDALGEAFGRFTPPDAPAPMTAAPAIGRPDRPAVVHRHLAGKSQTEILLGLPTISRSDTDYHPFVLADLIVGRLGLGGRLGDDLRDRRGLAYRVGSSFAPRLGPAPWSVSAGVSPSSVGAAVITIVGHLRRLVSEPVGPDELDTAVGYLTGVLPLSIETAEGLAKALVEMELYQLDPDYLQLIPSTYAGITADQVLAAVQRHLDPDRHILVVAGPADDV
jgi:zinc protease